MSNLNVESISNEAGTGPVTLTGQSAAKAWCRIHGSSGTPVIQGSLNVSSTTDNGVGFYFANYTSNFSGLTYAVGVAAAVGGQRARCDLVNEGSPDTGVIQILISNDTGTNFDGLASFSCDGDLA